MMIRLDNRLAVVAEMVRQGSVVADIGADHGYLVCSLVQKGTCPYGYACDINPMPLKRAQQTIEACGLTDKVETVLSEGLQGLSEKHVQDIVIAGMGGDLIAKIVSDAPWKWTGEESLILQPMSKPEHLRIGLAKAGFKILQEAAVVSGRFTYPVLRASYCGKPYEASLFFAWTGKMWENTDNMSQKYLVHTYRRLLKKRDGLLSAGDHAAAQQYSEVIQRFEAKEGLLCIG